MYSNGIQKLRLVKRRRILFFGFQRVESSTCKNPSVFCVCLFVCEPSFCQRVDGGRDIGSRRDMFM